MRSQTLGDKRDFLSIKVRNDESSATISRGYPVLLQCDGTEDGLAVVLPSSGSAGEAQQQRYGVAMDDILAGQIGEVMIWGLCNYVVLSLQTRANTSGGSSFSTAETVALFNALVINTVNNFFSTAASVSTIASDAAYALSAFSDPPGFIAQSLASAAGIATGTGETRSVITQAVKAFLRMM